MKSPQGLGARSVTIDPIMVYHETLLRIWDDGVLTAKERDTVAGLRARLGITDEEHAHLEHQVIDHLFPDGLPDTPTV